MSLSAISKTAFIALAAAAIAMIALTGCSDASSYKVSLDGRDDMYSEVKSSYRAGSKVKIYFKEECIGTDTDYSFYLDGERLNALYERGKGFRIEFEMPDHDVTVSYSAVNSMERDYNFIPDCLAMWRDQKYSDDRSSWQAEEYRLIRTEDESKLLLTLVLSYSTGTSYTYEYTVDADVYDAFISFAIKNDMEKWLGTYESEGDPARTITAEFWYDGLMYKVSSYCMPEDGMNTLDNLGYVLRRETEADE